MDDLSDSAIEASRPITSAACALTRRLGSRVVFA
jgi:hypothetical protein